MNKAVKQRGRERRCWDCGDRTSSHTLFILITQSHHLAGAQGCCSGRAFTDLSSFDIFLLKPLPMTLNINIFIVVLKPPTSLVLPVKQAPLLWWCGEGWTQLGHPANETHFRHCAVCLRALKMDLLEQKWGWRRRRAMWRTPSYTKGSQF